eukprot:Skav225494  [mRNA]  locus=scaffold1821:36567:37592:+ [translate_table: standard]
MRVTSQHISLRGSNSGAMEKGTTLANVVSGESIEARSYDQSDRLHWERKTLLADLLLPFGAAKNGHRIDEQDSSNSEITKLFVTVGLRLFDRRVEQLKSSLSHFGLRSPSYLLAELINWERKGCCEIHERQATSLEFEPEMVSSQGTSHLSFQALEAPLFSGSKFLSRDDESDGEAALSEPEAVVAMKLTNLVDVEDDNVYLVYVRSCHLRDSTDLEAIESCIPVEINDPKEKRPVMTFRMATSDLVGNVKGLLVGMSREKMRSNDKHSFDEPCFGLLGDRVVLLLDCRWSFYYSKEGEEIYVTLQLHLRGGVGGGNDQKAEASCCEEYFKAEVSSTSCAK